MNIGDLKIALLLDIVPLSESIKTALNMLTMFKQSADSILTLGSPKFQGDDFDNELKKLDNTLDSYKQSLNDAEVEQDQLGNSATENKTKVATLADGFANIGLRVQGLQSVVSVLKSTFGSLIEEYNKQEVANAKLENGLKNVGEGIDTYTRLTSQASTFQGFTPFADDEIQNAQSMLTTFKKSGSEIEILTPRILDLAAAYMKSGDTSMDLQQIAVMLGKVNEDTIGTLRRVGVAFTKEQEAKLKSLEGTEQAIYLSEILDSNFKGMAETVGNTAAGKMKIFQNQIGDLKEELGKLIADVLLPILTPVGSLIKWLASAPEPVKILTLAVVALAAAFLTLGTSMGGLPYIIGGLIAVFTSLNSVMKINTEELRTNQAQMLKNQEVTKDMKVVLDAAGISANNMAEAYESLSVAIMGMSAAQLQSAKDFIDAEIAKNEALLETIKTNEMIRVQQLGDVSTMEALKRGDINKFMFKEFTDIGPNLNKLYGLRDQIAAKQKFTPETLTKSGNTGTIGTSSDNKETEKEIDLVEQQIKLWSEALKIYYSTAETKKKLNDEGKSESAILQEINKFTEDNNELTKEQILKLDDYKQSLSSSGEINKDFLITQDDIIKRIKTIIAEEKRLYEEMQARNPNRKLKAFDEIGIIQSAIKLERDLQGEKIKTADLFKLLTYAQEQLNTLNRQNYKDTDKILQLEKLRTELKSQIQSRYDFERELNQKLQDFKNNLIENEFVRRRFQIESTYRKELDDYRKLLRNKGYSEEEYQARITAKQSLLAQRKSVDLAILDRDKYTAMLDAFSKGVSSASSIADSLGIGADSFVSKLLSGLQSGLSIVQQIRQILEVISFFKTITSVASFATGGLPIGSLGGGGMDPLSMNIPGLNSSASMSITREIPYIATVKADGKDFYVTMQRHKLNSARNNV